MKVLVLAGGNSSEREVSMTTGKAICESLRRLGHEVLAIDPASGQALLDDGGRFIGCDIPPQEETTVSVSFRPTALATGLSAAEYDDVELVFLALHGGTGENGTIQCLLGLAGKKYTGSSMTASAIAMNKAIAKRLFTSVGVSTPDWGLYPVPPDGAYDILVDEICQRFDFPMIVKPNASGSTVGLSKVESLKNLPEALERAATEGDEILVEQYIKGRELTVAVLDSHAFPVVEIIPKDGLYNYEAKYTEGKSEYIAPAKIPDELSKRVRDAAVKVYNVVGASGLTRIDFILDDSGEFYCLELNTLPGMTNLSLAPMAAQCEDIDFDGLIEMIIRSALNKMD